MEKRAMEKELPVYLVSWIKVVWSSLTSASQKKGLNPTTLKQKNWKIVSICIVQLRLPLDVGTNTSTVIRLITLDNHVADIYCSIMVILDTFLTRNKKLQHLASFMLLFEKLFIDSYQVINSCDQPFSVSLVCVDG